MFKGSKRKHSEGADGENDGGDVQKKLAKELQVYVNHILGSDWFVKTSKPKPFTATEALALYRSDHDRFLDRIKKTQDLMTKFHVTHAAQYIMQSGTPQMSLHDSETGKVVKKLKRRFRPVVKSTKPLPGWRVWLSAKSSEGDLIQSVAANYNWLGPVATTKKSSGGQLMRVTVENPIGSGGKETTHLDYGIYSYKTPKLLQEHQGFVAGYIVGRLDSYGHVVEHEHGYRAQKVIVRELWIVISEFSLNLTSIEDLSLRYDCPVHLLSEDKLAAWIDYHTEEAEDV